MPSSYSSNLRVELMATGENRSTWGTKANRVFNLLEEALVGHTTIEIDDENHSLVASNGVSDEARHMAITFTGTLTANRTITIPSAEKLYFMRNATAGGFSILVKTLSGNTLTIANGDCRFFFCDSTDIFTETYVTPISEGGTGTTTAEAARTALGLGNVNNTSDADKPVSTAQAAAIAAIGTIGGRDLTISSANPSGGDNGDIWLKI